MRFKTDSMYGQYFVIDQEKNIIYTFLGEPMYSTAQKFGSPTIGISQNIVTFAKSRNFKIRVFVGPQNEQEMKAFEIDAEQALEFCFLHNSYFDLLSVFKIRLLEIPWLNFETITRDPSLAEAWDYLRYAIRVGKPKPKEILI